jgi:3-deoxy-D-manno-octulosonate 8-phosphate phosphatase (KDO 8-P phosphatase)
MGDDVGDFQVMQKAGFKASPAQAESLVKNISDFVAPRQGGNGAVRDFCNFLLETRGIDPTTLNLW